MSRPLLESAIEFSIAVVIAVMLAWGAVVVVACEYWGGRRK